mmetsp:Transcript_14524/g.32595  ORF Transcript_14524/g.32595 Transcript_14524/m.32595 type:complete len:124 (+) Transcript_14524:117-488(+)
MGVGKKVSYVSSSSNGQWTRIMQISAVDELFVLQASGLVFQATQLFHGEPPKSSFRDAVPSDSRRRELLQQKLLQLPRCEHVHLHRGHVAMHVDHDNAPSLQGYHARNRVILGAVSEHFTFQQ